MVFWLLVYKASKFEPNLTLLLCHVLWQETSQVFVYAFTFALSVQTPYHLASCSDGFNIHSHALCSLVPYQLHYCGVTR